MRSSGGQADCWPKDGAAIPANIGEAGGYLTVMPERPAYYSLFLSRPGSYRTVQANTTDSEGFTIMPALSGTKVGWGNKLASAPRGWRR